MRNIDEMRKKRFQFLKLLHEKSGGNKHANFNKWDLGGELYFSHQETNIISEYLRSEDLLKYVAMGGAIAITHYGIKEVEEALSHPDQPTEYFPPINIINIHHMESSQIQQNTVGSTQSGIFNLSNKGTFEEFVRLLKEKIPELQLAQDDESELKADVATIETHLASSRPKKTVLKECLGSIQRVLEGTGVAVATHELLQHIPQLLSLVG